MLLGVFLASTVFSKLPASGSFVVSMIVGGMKRVWLSDVRLKVASLPDLNARSYRALRSSFTSSGASSSCPPTVVRLR